MQASFRFLYLLYSKFLPLFGEQERASLCEYCKSLLELVQAKAVLCFKAKKLAHMTMETQCFPFGHLLCRRWSYSFISIIFLFCFYPHPGKKKNPLHIKPTSPASSLLGISQSLIANIAKNFI